MARLSTTLLQCNRLGNRRSVYPTCSPLLALAYDLWLPLLEKAYAKIHGCYERIDGGTIGEVLETFSGGVSFDMYVCCTYP